jgi:hypothetical protein
MAVGYLVVPAERRVLCIALDGQPGKIEHAIGCQIAEHGTTFHTEDQLFVDGDEAGYLPEHRFMVAGVPFTFAGNAVLVGIDPLDDESVDRPMMTIDAFRRLITFAVQADARRRAPWLDGE